MHAYWDYDDITLSDVMDSDTSVYIVLDGGPLDGYEVEISRSVSRGEPMERFGYRGGHPGDEPEVIGWEVVSVDGGEGPRDMTDDEFAFYEDQLEEEATRL